MSDPKTPAAKTPLKGNEGDPNAVVAPKFGGYYPGHKDIVWVGGPPNLQFTGSFLKMPSSPLAIRGISPESEIKGYSKRVLEGCSTKFKRDDPTFTLMAFADEALNHMQATGMDTVFFMAGVDSKGEGGMELFTFHSRFTKTQVSKFIAGKIADGTFDEFAKTALKESAQWLINSLDESLKGSVRPHLASKPTGPEVWMLIVAEVQSDSLRRCSILVAEFKALSLAKFKGENVREFATAADNILLQLERDEQLPSTHLLDIVDAMSACTVMDFKIHWMARRTAVEKFVKETTGKDKQVVAQMHDKIHFRDLLEEAKTKFTNLQHVWGPAPGKDDAMLAQMKAMQATVNNLKQQLKAKTDNGGGDKPQGEEQRTCHHCKKKGHLKKNCPDLKNNNGSGNGTGGNQTKGEKGKMGQTQGWRARGKDV